MGQNVLRRRLWYTDRLDRIDVDEDFLRHDSRSLIILGEAGMGKTTLLTGLRGVASFAFCTARRLVNDPNPKPLLGGSTTLVIDALDEVSAQRESDAVDLVVRRLAELGGPRFILSCRVADWRSATALQGITEFYDPPPIELHLEPLSRDDALTFLAARLGDLEAERTIQHLEARGLSGLWRNPQTLEMVQKVAERTTLPHSKGELFSEATKQLRAEHRPEKSASPLASLPEADVLDAAGASFAALILTGKEALSRDVGCKESCLSLAEVPALPGASRIGDVLDSRLFEARASDRFTYTHRAIGEFLGARWLASRADTPRKRRRLMELLNNRALVPANLRGIHAWLAWHSPELADQVIGSDPMAVIEYGDADTLTAKQARALLKALYKLSEENPRFRGWSDYRAGGLVQPAMLSEVRNVIVDPSVEPGLRLLVLQALKSSDLLPILHAQLLALLLDGRAVFALRSEAGDRLAELNAATEWPNVLDQLVAEASENSLGLASRLMDQVGYAHFDDALVLATVTTRLGRAEHTVVRFARLAQNLPDNRIDSLLDGIAATAMSSASRHERGDYAIGDLVFTLLAKRLAGSPPDAPVLWSWLLPFDSHLEARRDQQKAIADALTATDELRRAVQRHVLLERESDRSIGQRAWCMFDRTSGLRPSEDDIVWLLDQLEGGDPRWRELVELTSHGPEAGAVVRTAAGRFSAGNATDQNWLADLAAPRVPEWQIKQERTERERADKRNTEWARHRVELTARIEAMRAGDYGCIVNPAKAYLNLFADIGEDVADGPARIEEWLGPELRDAALAGFELYLTAQPPRPTASEIAHSHAEGREWPASFILVAALAERVRTGRGFADLPDERLMAGFVTLLQSSIDEHAGIADLRIQLTRVLRARGQWEAVQRLILEPQLAARREHITGLYTLMQSTEDAQLVDRLGPEWLEKFPDLPHSAEIEILDRLLTSPEGTASLRTILPGRLEMALEDQRRLTWDAIGLILDFKVTRARLEEAGSIDKNFLWELRARLGDRTYPHKSMAAASLSVGQLAWIVRTFRAAFPYASLPRGVTTSDTNAWDATSYIVSLIYQLGNKIAKSATEALLELRNAPEDGYTDNLRIALAQQKRKRVEAEWMAPNLPAVAAAITDQAPTTALQLQAVMLEELEQVQKKLRGSNVDWYRDFYEGTKPRDEEDCRDTILKMFGTLPFGIQASPEGHLADDKRCDIVCTLSEIMVPIELKGQWHKELWKAADLQLDRLYTNDWRAGCGIYLVLWFGGEVSKKPRKPPAGIELPTTGEDLSKALETYSATTREGRTKIVVLDLTRPASLRTK